MTTDEAITVLNKINDLFGAEYENTNPMIAIEMAIEALEREQWIPCSSEMPDKKDVYLITVSDKETNRMLVCEACYLGENEWLMPDEDCYRLIAWRPLPEPYKENNE